MVSVAGALERGDPAVLADAAAADPAHAFSALNEAFAADGCLIRLGAGQALARPVQLLFVSVDQERPALVNLRNAVTIEDGARLDLIESHVVLGPGGALSNLVNHVVVGTGARVDGRRMRRG